MSPYSLSPVSLAGLRSPDDSEDLLENYFRGPIGEFGLHPNRDHG